MNYVFILANNPALVLANYCVLLIAKNRVLLFTDHSFIVNIGISKEKCGR